MRSILLTLVAAAFAGAGDDSPIAARGETLGEFEVALNVARIDPSSAESLARSYAAFDAAAANGCAAHFARLSADAHMEIVRRYYDPVLARTQEEAYDRLLAREGKVSCSVVRVDAEKDRAVAELARTGNGTDRLFLTMERAGAGWRLSRIERETEPGKRAPRDLGVPPPLRVPPIGPPAPPDLSTPDAAVASLRRDMARLFALRTRGQNEMNRHYFQIVRAFYGEEEAQRARDAQKAAPPAPELSYEFAKAAPIGEGLRRVDVLAYEAVPGTKDRRSAVGNAAFDLREGPGGWRIVRELGRPAPDRALRPVSGNLALFFLR